MYWIQMLEKILMLYHVKQVKTQSVNPKVELKNIIKNECGVQLLVYAIMLIQR